MILTDVLQFKRLQKKSLKNETRFEPVKEPTKISLASNKWLSTTSIREVEVPIPSNFLIIFSGLFSEIAALLRELFLHLRMLLVKE